MKHKIAIGRWGEQLAAQYLQERGYSIVAVNVRTPYGELDLIARIENLTVFVEVKTRTSSTYGLPEESVTPQKQAHILDAAQHYLQSHPEIDGDWRVDVIAIQGRPDNPDPQIVWFENAIQ